LLRLLRALKRNKRPLWSILSDKPNGEKNMVSCEKTLTSNRVAEEEAYLERKRMNPGIPDCSKGLHDYPSTNSLVNNGHASYATLGTPSQGIPPKTYSEAYKQEVDNVNHPPHYNNSPAYCCCGRRIECIDVTRHYSFNIGNAIKYLWRCELKGSALEDLKKAQWYIQDEIAKREKSR
jgi:hypothetical protein